MYNRKIIILPEVWKCLDGLHRSPSERILTKLEYYASLPDPRIYAKKLVNSLHGAYRYRIGEYRVIVDFDDEEKIIIVTVIWHRKDIYK